MSVRTIRFIIKSFLFDDDVFLFRRSYYLSYLREKKDGPLTLYDFHLSADVFNTSREENRGFCVEGPCLGDGVLNISTCYMGIEISKYFFSFH